MSRLFTYEGNEYYYKCPQVKNSASSQNTAFIIKHSNYSYYVTTKEMKDTDGNIVPSGTRVQRPGKRSQAFEKVVEADDIEWRPFYIQADGIWRTFIYRGGSTPAAQNLTLIDGVYHYIDRPLYIDKNAEVKFTGESLDTVIYNYDTELYYHLFDRMYLQDTDDLISYIGKLNSLTESSVGSLGQLSREEPTHSSKTIAEKNKFLNSNVVKSETNKNPQYRKNRPDFVNNVIMTLDGKLAYTMGEFTNVWTYTNSYIGASSIKEDDFITTYAISYAYINSYGQLSYTCNRIYHTNVGKEYKDSLTNSEEPIDPLKNTVSAVYNINLDRYGHVISTDSYTLPTKQYVDSLLEASDALHYCGSFTPSNTGINLNNESETTYTIDVSGSWTPLNTTYIVSNVNDNPGYKNEDYTISDYKVKTTAGSVYKVSTNGWFGNTFVHAGDLLISYSDSATKDVTTYWNIIETHVSSLTSIGKSKKNADDSQRLLTNVNLLSNGTVSYTYLKFTYETPNEYKNTLIDTGDNQPDGTQFISNINVVRNIDDTEMKYTISYTYGRLTYSTNTTYGIIKVPGNNGTSVKEVNLNSSKVIRSINVVDGVLTYTYSNLTFPSGNGTGTENNTIKSGSVSNTSTYIIGISFTKTGALSYTYGNINFNSTKEENVINQANGYVPLQVLTNINMTSSGELSYVYADSIGARYWNGSTYLGEIFNDYVNNVASGEYSHAEGQHTIASEMFSHAEGTSTIASNIGSHAEGSGTEAKGLTSHAEGYDTVAEGNSSHAEGFNTKAKGDYSLAEGNNTKAEGNSSHSEGNGTTASGDGSHAEGYSTKASGDYSHAEGYLTKASGDYSHAEGWLTEATGNYSHAEGSGKKEESDTPCIQAKGIGSHAEGRVTVDGLIKASGDGSHAEGYAIDGTTEASGDGSHAEGFETTASGDGSHAEGYNTEANKEYSHAEGNYTRAYGKNSHSEGYDTEASGTSSHAEGSGTEANKEAAHAEGYNTTSSAQAAHSEGNGTISSGTSSHAEGYSTVSDGNYSHSEGYSTKADGESSHTEGKQTYASGKAAHSEGIGDGTTSYGALANYSHSEGELCKTSGQSSHVEGLSNSITENGKASHAEGYLNTVDSKNSHAEGESNNVSGQSAHVEGMSNTVSGKGSHSEGYSNYSNANYSHTEGRGNTVEDAAEDGHAEGYNTKVIIKYGHAEGDTTLSAAQASHAGGTDSIALGQNSFTHGNYTTSYNYNEISVGSFNVSYTYGSSTSSFKVTGVDGAATLFNIGNGTSYSSKCNAFDVRRNGTAYIYNDAHITHNIYGQQIIADSIFFINYSQLVSLVSNSKLIPGSYYRIIDYTTTSGKTNVTSYGKQFDVIVLALSVNKLSCKAKATNHDTKLSSQFDSSLNILQKPITSVSLESYFKNYNLSKWEIWYDINNDTKKYDWAVSTGKGVIYKMIDEYGNEAPYDFKNILINKKFTFGNSTTDDSLKGASYNNVIKANISSGKMILPTIYLGTKCYNNIIDNDCNTITIGNSSSNNIIENTCTSITLGSNCVGNHIYNNSTSITLGDTSTYNIIGEYNSYIVIGTNCSANTFKQNCQYIVISSNSSVSYSTLVSNTKPYICATTFEEGIKFVNLYINVAIGSAINLNCTVNKGISGTSSTAMKVVEVNQFNYQTGFTKNIEFKPVNSQVVEII